MLNGVWFDTEMTWMTEYFQQIVQDKLGEDPINKIELSYLNCSSFTLNELLSVLHHNMAEDGLKKLWFVSFPQDCELDPNLITDIATKAAPTLRSLGLMHQKLQP